MAAWFFFGTGELFPDGVALWPAGPSSHEEVEEPDSSSDDNVGGWSPVWVDCKHEVNYNNPYQHINICATYSFVFGHQLIQLVLFLVVVKELFALFSRLGAIELLRNESPISSRAFQAWLQGVDLVLCPGDGISWLCLLFDHGGWTIRQLSNSSCQSSEASRATFFRMVSNVWKRGNIAKECTPLKRSF